MSYLSHRVDRDQIKPGDHIYSWRMQFNYAHHGIYVGENKVIHFTSPENASLTFVWNMSSQPKSCDHDCGSIHKSTGGVFICCLNCFIGTGSLYLYQYGVSIFTCVSKLRGGTCTIAPSDPPQDVIARANYLLQHGFTNYNLIRNNCEDFALYCKTGLLITTAGA
ncbi:hypothetical protein L1987_56172 [Smallanthus sonchifolius]|uniref:Uncharacterized protein n=1 Tax=Smallanthus sonchifolius TaxID=185202 RepID=A0ACB9EC27_9ASTR|nr:hypothetical protein L1987_56172 [Smallanthus sonchifolius]